jgi:hypothetical protein
VHHQGDSRKTYIWTCHTAAQKPLTYSFLTSYVVIFHNKGQLLRKCSTWALRVLSKSNLHIDIYLSLCSASPIDLLRHRTFPDSGEILSDGRKSSVCPAQCSAFMKKKTFWVFTIHRNYTANSPLTQSPWLNNRCTKLQCWVVNTILEPLRPSKTENNFRCLDAIKKDLRQIKIF